MNDSVVKLRSFDEYFTICTYSPGKEVEIYNTNDRVDVNGSFSYLAECFIAIYRKDSELFLAVDGSEYNICNVQFDHRKIGFRRQLNIFIDGRKIKTCLYRSKFNVVKFLLDIISFNDFSKNDEDYDFGLFVTNISRDRERQQIFLDPESDC